MGESSLKPSDLEQAIFRTVAWFSLSEYPVTGFEIWKWLLRPTVSYRLSEVLRVLEESCWLAARVHRNGGFFVLRSADPTPAFPLDKGMEMSALRHDRFLNAARKHKRLALALKYLGRIPTVRAIAACNTLAWSNTTETSDIDLFIITSPRRIWITRLLTALPFALMGLRPGSNRRDPFCFSFFVTEEAGDLAPVQLHAEDIYLAQWIRSLVPVYGQQIFASLQTQNRWVHRIFPNAFPMAVARPRRQASRRAFPLPIGFFEPILRFMQQRHLPVRLRELANKDTRVIINDRILKFHDNDRRAEFYSRWQALCLNAGC